MLIDATIETLKLVTDVFTLVTETSKLVSISIYATVKDTEVFALVTEVLALVVKVFLLDTEVLSEILNLCQE